MMRIKKDFLGLYAIAGGYIVRPIKEPRFKEGEEVKTHHFGGTCVCGIGKNENCAHGRYFEYWLTSGIDSMNYKKMKRDKIRERWNWYLRNLSFQIQNFTHLSNSSAREAISRKIKQIIIERNNL